MVYPTRMREAAPVHKAKTTVSFCTELGTRSVLFGTRQVNGDPETEQFEFLSLGESRQDSSGFGFACKEPATIRDSLQGNNIVDIRVIPLT
jgi:hypothetical protein